MTAPSHVRVVFVGSSSVSASSPLPGALATELGLARGASTAQGRVGSRLALWTRPPWPAGLTTDAIVVLLTGNDARPTAASVAAVDHALRERSPIVVWLPPLPYRAGSSAAGRDRRMREAIAAAGVAHLAIDVELAAQHWARDRVHLTRAGYHAYAREVAVALRAALAVEPIATAPAPVADAPLGRLVTPQGAELPLLGLDALWMARALAGEGGPGPDAYAITSAMLRRWAMLWDGGERRFGALADLLVGRFRGASPYDADAGEVELRGYSQPIAVQWRTRRGERAERRRQIRSLGWEAIEPWRREAVLRLFTGQAPLVAPGAVHFAARSLVERQVAIHPGWRVVRVPGAAHAFVSLGASRGREPHVLAPAELRSKEGS